MSDARPGDAEAGASRAAHATLGRRDTGISEPVAELGVYPIMPILASFPIACFTGALVTDIAYVGTANIIWADFSAWLLAAGMTGGLAAALLSLVRLVTRRRDPKPAWAVILGSLLVLVVAFFNNLVHSRDGWTSVMPMGLALSVVTVTAMLATAGLVLRTARPRPGVVQAHHGGRY